MDNVNESYLEVMPNNRLIFTGSFVHVINESIILKNLSEDIVRFKVKTTAPSAYKVYPNAGTISGKGDVVISIALQPFEYQINQIYNHKFKVFSVLANINNDTNDWELQHDSTHKEYKILCQFEYHSNDDQVSLISELYSVDHKFIFNKQSIREIKHEKEKRQHRNFGSVTEEDNTTNFSSPNTEDLSNTSSNSPKNKEDYRINQIFEDDLKSFDIENSVMYFKNTIHDQFMDRYHNLTAFKDKWQTRKQFTAQDLVEKDWAIEYMRSPLIIPPMIYLLIAFVMGAMFGMIFL